jgi:hypothetical protein
MVGLRAAEAALRDPSAKEPSMTKLKLGLEDLRVDTFEAGAIGDLRGTVHGLAVLSGGAAVCCTRIQTGCNPDITSVFTGACCPAKV